LGVKAGCGTVYELSPPKQKGGPWTERLRYSFKGGNDGYFPSGTLTFDSKGNLYGATQFGGGKGTTCNSIFQYCGTVFELRPARQKGGQWTEKVLHSFAGGKDGANPSGGLLIGNTGAVYGTGTSGGNSGCKTNYSVGCGVFFTLKRPTGKGSEWTEELSYVFSGKDDGAMPILGGRGILYGTTFKGGTQQRGVVFQLSTTDRNKWHELVIHNFGGQEGWNPVAGVIVDNEGNLYGTASTEGLYGAGTAYRLSRKGNTWRFGVVHTFSGRPDGVSPSARLARDTFGDLYGTTLYGGTGQSCRAGCGTVFEVSP
jgi:uncharacterized repeat protein (TIGR03803 family)